MANLGKYMRKLQKAIVSSGFVIKLNTDQFYSKTEERMITMYTIATPIDYQNKCGQWKRKDYEILRTSAISDIVICLAAIWNEVKEWH